jgi:hypothetical protein
MPAGVAVRGIGPRGTEASGHDDAIPLQLTVKHTYTSVPTEAAGTRVPTPHGPSVGTGPALALAQRRHWPGAKEAGAKKPGKGTEAGSTQDRQPAWRESA